MDAYADPLAPDDVDRFARDGFLAVPGLVAADDVLALRGPYDHVFEPGVADAAHRVELAAPRDGRPTLPQVLDPDRYSPALREGPVFAAAEALARQLLGPAAAYLGMHAIRKPARSGAETPWHQDEAYWDPAFDHPAVSVWLPLQDVTVDHGCLSFVAGSHRGEVVPHELVAAGADGLRVSDPGRVGTATVCPLPVGGATVHAGRTLHHGGPNRTDAPRRALIMAFRTAPVPRTDDRRFPWQPASWYDGD